MVEKFMVGKFMIEKSGVEKSGLRSLGLKSSWLKSLGLESSLLKSPGLKCPSTFGKITSYLAKLDYTNYFWTLFDLRIFIFDLFGPYWSILFGKLVLVIILVKKILLNQVIFKKKLWYFVSKIVLPFYEKKLFHQENFVAKSLKKIIDH